MSILTLQEVKDQLKVRHNSDDAVIQNLIDICEDEALQFLNRKALPVQDVDPDTLSESDVSDTLNLAPSIKGALFVLIDMKYNSYDPKDLQTMRDYANNLMWPYREKLGV